MRYLNALVCAVIIVAAGGCGSQAAYPSSPTAVSASTGGTFDYHDPYAPYDPYPPSAPLPPGAAAGTIAVTPSYGPTAGGVPVTITGSGFAPGTTVMFGPAAAAGVTVIDDATLTAITPPSVSGWVDVLVAFPDGHSHSLAGGFTYADEPAPGETATITITPTGNTPKAIQIAAGSIVRLVNNDIRPHDLESDPHPTHTECPEANGSGFLVPGGSGQTQPFMTPRTCGLHDHNDPVNPAWMSRIVIR